MARGDWIAFLDSDDIWLPEKIEWQLRAIERHKNRCGASVTNARLIDRSINMDTTSFLLAGGHYKETIGILPNARADLVKSLGCIWIQALLVRSDLAKRIGGFDDDLHFAEDQDFLFRLSAITSLCYVNIPLVVIDRARAATDPNVGVRVWDSAEFRLRAKQQMYEKWLTDENTPPSIRRLIAQNLGGVHSALANLHLQRGQFDMARQALSVAVKYELTFGLVVKFALTRVAPRMIKKLTAAHDAPRYLPKWVRSWRPRSWSN